MRKNIRVAAAQTFPEMFDFEGTLQKVDFWLDKAVRESVDLIVFPETFISAYPYWRGSEDMKSSMELLVKMQDSAIELGTQSEERLRQIVRNHKVNVVIGANELSRQGGQYTLYNSQIFLNREGEILACRRKLMPTHSERVYWGFGDREDVLACDFDVGRVGGLICYEHHLGLLGATMGMFGEDVHCAMWPGWWHLRRHFGDKQPAASVGNCDIDPMIRSYAIHNGCFVVSVSPYAPEKLLSEKYRGVYVNQMALGGSAIVNPSGIYITEPDFGGEKLVLADIDLTDKAFSKGFFDAFGHYSRNDVLAIEGAERLIGQVSGRGGSWTQSRLGMRGRDENKEL